MRDDFDDLLAAGPQDHGGRQESTREISAAERERSTLRPIDRAATFDADGLT